MINASELRIGNWLEPAEPEYKGQYFKIAGGDIKHIQEGMTRYTYQPIPLTPDILEKCGFARAEHSSVYKLIIKYADENYPCSLQLTGDGIQICRSGVGAITAPVKHLHQLQNLYFSLTGKELEYKP